mmetsp:Transcript_98669/g.318149  ORF Transcript_98669/g.318149 Transcript_98669/m.318149 type:complete len:239 (-) Transcript_98669:348-1064(-)
MLSFTVFSGPMTTRARAGSGVPCASISSGSSMPSMATISLVSSAMMGKARNWPPSFWMFSRCRMSALQAACVSTGSQEMAMSFTRRSRKLGARTSLRPSSVVQTGVKSLGWLKRMVQGASGSQSRNSWKSNSPCVVRQKKFGISAPSLILQGRGTGVCASSVTRVPSTHWASAAAAVVEGDAVVRVTRVGEAALEVAPAMMDLPGMYVTWPMVLEAADLPPVRLAAAAWSTVLEATDV